MLTIIDKHDVHANRSPMYKLAVLKFTKMFVLYWHSMTFFITGELVWNVELLETASVWQDRYVLYKLTKML